MNINGSEIWAGTEESYQTHLKGEEAKVARMSSGEAFKQDQEEDKPPRLLEVQDGIANISIHGSLNNSSDSWWNDYIGATGYPEIRDAMVSAANDPAVKHIILDINSGGGTVSGVSDTAKLIRTINDKVKPVTAFTDGSMYSAAYWLGSSAGEVHASEGAGVGSIGVIATHMERSAMLKEAGIGVTVVRAGKYKALANGVEKLSEEGKAQIQAGVDAAYKIFVSHVADMRDKSYEYADQHMAQGQEFFGQKAADVGLVDSITTFDSVVGEIKKKFMDGSNNLMDNRARQVSGLRVENGDSMMSKKVLDEAAIAALASGAGVSASVEESAEEVAGAAEAGEKGEQASASTAAAEVDTSAAMLKVTTDQLAATNAELLTARLALAKLEDKLKETVEAMSPLKEIAAKAVNNMRIALNTQTLDLSAMQSAQLVAEYNSTLSMFQANFKAGGISAGDADKSTKKVETIDPKFKAQVRATGLSAIK